MNHTIAYVALAFLILTFLFFIASVFVLEFAVTVDSDGDILIPWYYWFFFAGAGVFLVVFVILQCISTPYPDKNIKESHEVEYREVEVKKVEYERPVVQSVERPIVSMERPIIQPTHGDPLLSLLRQ